MKRRSHFIYLLLMLLSIKATGQQVYFPTIYNPSSCQYNYEITIYVSIDSIEITNIYYDDSTTGSFAFEAYVSYNNNVVNSTLPIGNFYTYQISAYSDNPNLNTPILTNHLNGIPWVTGSAGGFPSANNPTYTGSASALGLSQGQYYSSPSILSHLGYDSMTLQINLPCLDTLMLSNSVPLPLLWSRLNADIQGNEVILSWQTFKEEDNSGFWVERSTDALHWDRLRLVTSQAQNGYDGQTLYYRVPILEPSAGRYFYRLVQKNRNNKNIFSNVVSAKMTTNLTSSIYAYPNPAKNRVYFTLAENAEYSITDILGRIIKRGKYKDYIDITSFGPGTYWIRSGNYISRFSVEK